MSKTISTSPEQAFGELRSMLQAEMSALQHARLWELLSQVQSRHPGLYAEQWVPYLQGHTQRWQNSPLELTTINDFFHAVRLVPFAPLSLNLPYSTSLRRNAENAFVRSQRLGHLHTLHIPCESFDWHSLTRLIGSEYLENIHTLGLYDNNQTHDLIDLLTYSPTRPTLRHLVLANYRLTSPKTHRQLQELPCFETLEEITLQRAYPETELDDFFAAPQLTRLRALNLRHTSFNLDRTRALVSSPHLSSLESLSFDNGQLDQPEVEETTVLLDLPALPTLRHLSLSGHYRAKVPMTSFRAFIHSPHLGNLESLALDHNVIGVRSLRWLLESPSLAGLTHLSLKESDLGKRGYEVLANAPLIANLESLELGQRIFRLDGAATLLDSPYLPDHIKEHYAPPSRS